MSNSPERPILGLDLGSSYVKVLVMDRHDAILKERLTPTGYDYQDAVQSLLKEFPDAVTGAGITGYGRYEWPGSVQKTEISCLAKGLVRCGIREGTLVDIGGQDCKVLSLKDGALEKHHLNRRCAAGTGSYLEFLAFRLQINCEEMNAMAASTRTFHSLNSFCTVFTSTEILDCLKKKVPLPDLVRGMYASIAERAREMAPMEPPVRLSGGVAAHHPVLREVFSQVLDTEVTIAPHPQFLAAYGAALYAKEVPHDRPV